LLVYLLVLVRTFHHIMEEFLTMEYMMKII